MNFLNNGYGYILFEREQRKTTYVDKSLLVDSVFRYGKASNPYICITRPRRFGKSTAANMIAAFFDPHSMEKSRQLFENLKIGQLYSPGDEVSDECCWKFQGKLNVIRMNMIDMINEKTHSYRDFTDTLERRLLEDIALAYPSIRICGSQSIPEILEKTNDSFIFVIDEWDAILEMSFMSEEDRQSYILFLKALLKDKPYIHFVYMTGILPIAKYSSGSPLNMFDEFSSFQDATFYSYFGMTREEIRALMNHQGFSSPSMEELSFWYDGYVREPDNEHIYNPNSVSKALAAGVCKSYWTGTGPMNEVRDIIQHNVKDLREDIIRMAGGEKLEIKLAGFSAEKQKISTKDEILSAMVVYGFLTYHGEELSIPNHELKLKFQEALSAESLGLHQTLAASKELLQATLNQKNAVVARLIEELHDSKIPFFQYNDENSLSCVVVMGYLAALDDYQIIREDQAGKGYVDFTFTPMRKGDLPIILELKYNRSAKNALKCIHNRGYIRKFADYPKVLLVGINYSEKTKKHTCLTELVEQTIR